MAVDPSVFTPWFGPQQAANYFRSLISHEVSETQVLDINRYLLRCVHDGGITPKIFAVWLFLAHPKFPCILEDALRDEASRGVRKTGINVLKCALRTDQWWKNGWEAVGGTAGLQDIFEKISIQEARSLARAIGSCSNTTDPLLRQAIDELLHRLLPNFFKSSSTQFSGDSQQLLKLEDVISLCNLSSDATLMKVFSTPLPDDVTGSLMRQLLNSHMSLLRDIAVRAFPVHPPLRKRLLDQHLAALLTSVKPYESRFGQERQTGFPAIDFSSDLLAGEFGVSEKSRVVSWHTRIRCINITLTTSRRRRVPFDAIFALLQHVIPDLGHSERTLTHWVPLIHSLIELWVIAAFPDAHLQSISDAPVARYRERLHPSRPQTSHRDSLEAMLRTAFCTLSSDQFQHCLRTLLPRTVPEARLPLLKILCKNLQHLKIDLEEPMPSVKEHKFVPWSWSFLMSLPGRDARWLLERTKLLSPNHSLVNPFVFEWPASAGDSSYFRDALIRVHFDAMDREAADPVNSAARELIEDVKLRAVKARDPEDRLQWAKLTITIAKRSRDIRLVQDVIYWTSRFVRDPFVRPELARRIYREDVASILSCVMSPTVEDLAAKVSIADEVVSHLLEQALLTAQEPWYRINQDRGFGQLLKLVVSSRIHAVKRFCFRGLGSEQNVVDTLFKGIVPILFRYETVGSTEGYESLGWGQLSGPLSELHCPPNPPVSILKLLDSLAQHRDHLWVKQRGLRIPQAESLPEGLPRGLPLQYLLPSQEWTIAVMKSEGASAFVTQRVTEVVLSNPDLLLRKVKEDGRKQYLVDSLRFAIEAYLGHLPVADRGKKLLEIWSHYSEKIPSSAGHLGDFKKYMCSLLESRSLRRLERIIDPPQSPSLVIFENMSCDSPSIEWEPRSTNVQQNAQNCWEKSLLQVQFLAVKENWPLERMLATPNLGTCSPVPEKPKTLKIWSPKYSPRTLPCQYRESLIASALLFLNSLAHNADRILSKPFPENTDILRYPPVHLDYDFLSSIDDQKKAATAAIDLLNRLVKIVPSTLLYHLSLSFLEALHVLESVSPNYALVQRLAFKSMALVRRSDRPDLAAKLGMKALQLFPEASSWHRVALPSSLTKVLSRANADRVIRDFTAYVFKALEEQKQPAMQNSGTAQSGKLVIKITTVKMLATMLAESRSGASPLSAIQALKVLFHASNHIDVRVAVCTAMLEIVGEYDDCEQAYETFTSLTPYAAVPSETSACESWLQSENAELPRVDWQRPLLDLFTNEAYDMLPARYHEHYTCNALLPLLDELARQHNRWMRQFLAPLDLTPEELSVADFGPFEPDMIQRIMERWYEYLPREFLLKYRAWMISYLDCMRLRNVDDKMTGKDESWRTSDSYSHWSRWFGAHARMKSFHVLMGKFGAEKDTKVQNGITREDLADVIMACAETFLRNPFKLVSYKINVSLDRIMDLLSTLGITDTKRRTHVLPIAERIVAFAQGLRIVEWSYDPYRSPPVLPSSFQLHTMLLPFPQFYKTDPFRYTRFVSSTLDLVQECVCFDTYQADSAALHEAMNHVTKEDARQCALEFGQRYDSSATTLVQYVRVELAHILALKCSMHRDEKDLRGRAMMLQWRNSPNESIRSIGWSIYPQAM
ncbi:uncharacterized protein BO87DRAFT_345320 [Aspergillus neoniger CBS 115656]|uniref:Uncharacterized protein n=1 Tax=Aspergillus neoniger (strain CBS 115656) TaxID=1448310 RepID=A0A318Y4I1_ASPNB|nr:hypothetical protein BO87DRAFT_345320 [Aspergillus neoniger CBS 115656]PYH29176.1 hypothetical protein BO87DRAFT_345320 [Aspergillus neoniger CBS 115656]